MRSYAWHSTAHQDMSMRCELARRFVIGKLSNQRTMLQRYQRRQTDAEMRQSIEQIEERLNEEVVHPLFGYRVTYRRCLELQARLLAKVLTGEIDEYPPLLIK